ncbi:MAG: BspA family leucine-rich repeat surface protein [Ruminococcus sp.]
MLVSIDIGTSYSSICMAGADGKIQPVDVGTGISVFGSKHSLPTAVFLEDNGNVLVGQAAMNSRKRKPQNFRMEFKRELGQNTPIFLGNESFMPEDLYTKIFIHFKQCAEKAGGEPIEKAYITYPASYSKSKRERIIAAAKSAGLFNVVLVDEPTAAAMSYAAEGALKDGQNLMVYDFGGGTFDVSLVRYENGKFTLLTEPYGLEHCGGIDIDRIIFKDIMSKVDTEFLQQLKKANRLNYMKFECQMSELSVKAKHHLSVSECFEDEIPVGLFDSVPYQLTREKFNSMTAKLIGQTITACNDILKRAELKISDLSAVLMVGGTSRVPLVRDMVKQFAGKVPVLEAKDLELAVACGAIKYDSLGNNDRWRKNVMMSDLIDEYAFTPSFVFGSSIKRSEIATVIFTDTLEDMPQNAWDVSADRSERVMAWITRGETIDNYFGVNLFIGAEGGINGKLACNKMFCRYEKLRSVRFNGCLHTDEAENMSCMFYGCESLTSLDVSGFDTSKVTNMRSMFGDCRSLTSLDVSGFDTSKVTNMSRMFCLCKSLTSLDLSSFDTSKVTDMSGMFDLCESLTSLDVSGFDTSNVTNMQSMFYHCSSLTSLVLSSFDTSKVTDMSYMFHWCESLTSLDVSGFDTSKVTDMASMFYLCGSLTSLDLSSFDTPRVTDMSDMFWYCKSLTRLDVSSFDTSEVTNMSSMFMFCESLTSLDVSGFDTSKVTDMSRMFYVCESLTSLDVSGFDTSEVTNMSSMFECCKSLTSLDVSGFDTSKVNDMSSMFAECRKLDYLCIKGFSNSKAT